LVVVVGQVKTNIVGIPEEKLVLKEVLECMPGVLVRDVGEEEETETETEIVP
jgi:hypothetical protein